MGTLDADSWTGSPSGDNFCPSQGAASFAPEPFPRLRAGMAVWGPLPGRGAAVPVESLRGPTAVKAAG